MPAARAAGEQRRSPRRCDAAKADAPLRCIRCWIGSTAGWAARTRRNPAPPCARPPRARFQQLTAPVAAKAVEDTAFYRYGRLLSRNESASMPRRLACRAGRIPCRLPRRGGATFPDALLATATHDHKRGEDLRARLAVLSEIPDDWADGGAALDARPMPRTAGGCARPSARRRGAALPDDRRRLAARRCRPTTPMAASEFAERLAGWQQKAHARGQAAQATGPAPDEAYEAAAATSCSRCWRPARALCWREAAAFRATDRSGRGGQRRWRRRC